MEALVRRTYAAPGWGTGEVWLRGRVLLLHVVAGSASSPASGEDVAVGPAPHRGGLRPPDTTLDPGPSRGSDGFATALCGRFATHLGGTPTDYDDVELELDGLTPFERALTVALRAVPWGEVVTYGELAALAGRPGAARAAGTFCAGSDASLVVPCHRVVAAGGIGGYGPDGVAFKRRLLALEGVRL